MPILFTSRREASALARGVKSGRLRRLGLGLYTDDLLTDPAKQVRQGWVAVASHYFPGGVVTDRSRPTAMPDPNGLLFVVHPRARPVELPGLTIVPRAGHAAFDDDLMLPPGLRLASLARGMLE